MEDVGATVFYDDEDDCLDYDCMHNVEYDYDYVDTEKENLYELYQYCLSPTLYDTGYYMLPLLGSTILFRLFVHTRKILVLFIYAIYVITYFANYFIIKRSVLYFSIHIVQNISYTIGNHRLVYYSTLYARMLSHIDSICPIFLCYLIHPEEMAWWYRNLFTISFDNCILVCIYDK